MAIPQRRSGIDEQQLIEKHIDLDYDRYPYRRADVWLRRSGASVWAIIMFFGIYNGDRDALARHFDISQEEIDAAFAYYRLNKRYVDARITLEEA
jgi:hypothetical protein